ncbi:hypothetical protein POM88_031069 [Heracleum sosnowskyi]|uniref:Uncharacterized protein n=1 Tax=Heracleum sosnowskyi TaxID=360622 RepID=A0AAD8HY39_9APIA|nr:hypothetical protein POM88_031069 [Heracleum sosnowskyi]
MSFRRKKNESRRNGDQKDKKLRILKKKMSSNGCEALIPYKSTLLLEITVCQLVSSSTIVGKMNMGGKPEDKSTHNPCALPAVTQVIVAAKGVTDPLIQSIRKFGENNFRAGNGPGLGFGPFGHDFGSNLGNTLRVQGSSVIPGAVHKVQSCFAEMMLKFAIAQKMSSVQGILQESVKSGITSLNDPKDKFAIGSIKEMAKSVPENISRLGLSQDVKSQIVPAYKTLASKGLPSERPYGSRAEKVIASFLKNPVMNGEDKKVQDDRPQQNAEHLQLENLLKMVLKHQQVIDELLEENMKLREIMVEDLKISPSKLQDDTRRPLTHDQRPPYEGANENFNRDMVLFQGNEGENYGRYGPDP